MTEQLSKADVLRSIEPKSDQLNADDLVGGDIEVDVISVTPGPADQPIHVHLKGYEGRPYKPCKTMRRVLVEVWSGSPEKWLGGRLRLHRDPTVKFGGKAVGGIVITAMSGIDAPKRFMLTVTRGKKKEHTVHPLKSAPQSDEQADRIRNVRDLLGKVRTEVLQDNFITFAEWASVTLEREVQVPDLRRLSNQDLKVLETRASTMVKTYEGAEQ